jgi:hypothetical protein
MTLPAMVLVFSPGVTATAAYWLVPACGAATMVEGTEAAAGAAGLSGNMVDDTVSHPANPGPKPSAAIKNRVREDMAREDKDREVAGARIMTSTLRGQEGGENSAGH